MSSTTATTPSVLERMFIAAFERVSHQSAELNGHRWQYATQRVSTPRDVLAPVHTTARER